MEHIDLLKEAKQASLNSYAPYSKFKVGAALLLDNGKVITGVNVENASFGATNCAERTALFTSITKGYSKENIKAMAIYANTDDLISPCGICRQVMDELLTSKCDIILGNNKLEYKVFKKEDLLPSAFDNKVL
ncbi:MAG: cytidine deaminase [Mycoplasmatales bacterium]